MEALPFLGRSVVVLRDRTRGSVEIAKSGAAQIRYQPVREDLERLRLGIKAIARAYLAADASEVYLPVNHLPPVRSEKDLAALDAWELDTRDLSLLYAVHLFGGACMAGSAERGFLNEAGRAWGVRGLFVTDASGLPGNTGVNPQITILANALRIAEGIVA
jgi:choline dehydrogenase-like flavoprotein